MQISLNGLPKNSLPDDFPYVAMNPMSAKKETFNSIEDVYEKLVECYDKCKQKGFDRLGEALYEQALFFVNIDKLIDQDCQLRIKEHKFCKEFNCPPYPSLKDTPANVIDEFTIIQEEINNFTSKDKK